MADESSILSTSIRSNLCDKSAEKRKQATLDIEAVVRGLLRSSGFVAGSAQNDQVSTPRATGHFPGPTIGPSARTLQENDAVLFEPMRHKAAVAGGAAPCDQTAASSTLGSTQASTGFS
mmetsp:Transcript_100660/g.215754  ORF Transcript_100660/g.215754 Transcript_100660/m.215754 type:complete len:119 (+) Transcript_100660:62-418(+)